MAIVGFNRLSRGIFMNSLCSPCQGKKLNFGTLRFSSLFGEKVKSIPKKSLKFIVAGVPVTALGAGYYLYKSKQEDEEPQMFEKSIIPHPLLPSKPQVPIARSIAGEDKLNLNLTLFQYPTCPFCCKVRAFLDYYGLPYEVVEVNPVFRQQTSWTTYKKVPILLAKVNNGYQQLNDSTMIISALRTYLLHNDQKLEEIVNFYPMVELKDNKGTVKSEILNKYFLMYQENLPKDKTTENVLEEKTWREWADNTLVHMLSPNVYRTFDEAMQAFKWFSEVGEWDRLFSAWERFVIINVGALMMWIIGKRLKKRHKLREDVREDLYHACRKWMKAISAKGTPFMGGTSPNLADLAVYGVLSSIEGCLAFEDLLANTKIGNWYYPMKEAVSIHQGRSEIHL